MGERDRMKKSKIKKKKKTNLKLPLITTLITHKHYPFFIKFHQSGFSIIVYNQHRFNHFQQTNTIQLLCIYKFGTTVLLFLKGFFFYSTSARRPVQRVWSTSSPSFRWLCIIGACCGACRRSRAFFQTDQTLRPCGGAWKVYRSNSLSLNCISCWAVRKTHEMLFAKMSFFRWTRANWKTRSRWWNHLQRMVSKLSVHRCFFQQYF